MSHPAVRTERAGRVLTITLARPERRNAQLPSMWAELVRLADELPADVAVVLLKGAGQDFSAGLDRALLTPGALPGEESVVALAATGNLGAVEAAIAGYQRAFTAWSACHAVVVAVVQGNAIGAGFQLALAADLRVCADDARFAMREVELGLVPDLGGIGVLARSIGEGRTLELCVTGRIVDAAEAFALGLVSRVVTREELDSTASNLADSIVAMPPAAVRAIKPLVMGASTRERDEQLALERAVQAERMAALVAAKPADRR